jgi:transcriptional regulator with XRE-family HTH domain
MNEDIFLNKVGKKISEYRSVSGITSEELSSKTGIEAENIAAIEKGKFPLMLEEFLHITRAIGIDPAKAMEGIN